MITYITGDLFQHIGSERAIVAHVCNDQGAWGKGFVTALSRQWKKPELDYHQARKQHGLYLGDIQMVHIHNEIWVCNMIAQSGLRSPQNKVPLRYEALRTCLMFLEREATERGLDVHMPKIGTGLAGGDWRKIEPMIDQYLSSVHVCVYVLP
jgi:O-acetyl-ADP-ribose deacetylase (regulator of RNase III)